MRTHSSHVLAEETRKTIEALERLLESAAGEESLDLRDKIEIERRNLDFYEGGGFEVVLRVMPMPWSDPNPARWNWQELLDQEAVKLVSCVRKGRNLRKGGGRAPRIP